MADEEKSDRIVFDGEKEIGVMSQEQRAEVCVDLVISLLFCVVKSIVFVY